MKNIYIILLCLTALTLCQSKARKIEVMYLMNGGGILSTFEDWITLKLTSTGLNNTINCAEGRGYTYKPGTVRRFNSLWLPEGDIVGITLVQYNIWSKDDAITVSDTKFKMKKVGFYQQ